MQEPSLAHDEAARIAALCSTGQLDTPIEGRFEIITRLARRVMDVPIAAVSLVDADRQWFKSINGLDVTETGRDVSFCGHTILNDEPTIVPDARLDPRFADNPLVTGPPNIVFYLGYPISARCGGNIATLCLIDTKPRNPSEKELVSVRDLASMAEQQLNATAQKSVATEMLSRLGPEQRTELIDPSTRLWNPSGIDGILSRQIDKAIDTEQGIALISIRVDYPNHPEPHDQTIQDQLLREVARRLLVGIRQWDNVGYTGRNEFVVVLGDGADQQHAIHSAERLRTQLNQRPVKAPVGEVRVQATLAVVCEPTGFTCSKRQLIDRALSALDHARSHGSDEVFVDTTLNEAA